MSSPRVWAREAQLIGVAGTVWSGGQGGGSAGRLLPPGSLDYSRSVSDETATCRVAPDPGCVLGVRKEAAGPARGPATPTEPFT